MKRQNKHSPIIYTDFASKINSGISIIRKSRSFMAGTSIVLAFVIIALAASIISPYDPNLQNLSERFKPPSLSHLMGTDQLGRDVFSRMIYGTRTSLAVGFSVVLISLPVGIIVGSVSGFVGGKLDLFLMRIADVFLAFPGLVLAIGLMAILGQGITNIVLSLSAVTWPTYARAIRSETLSLRERDYILASRLMNSSTARIVFRHVIPNTIAPIIVLGALGAGFAILGEAGLSFLGLGTSPNVPTWGSIIADGREYFIVDPYLMLFPGVILSLAVLGFNLMADGLRDILDPASRN
jgi:peptide/nickel transport system permease protein